MSARPGVGRGGAKGPGGAAGPGAGTRAGGPAGRFEAYSRYLALLEQQLQALETGDLERFGVLADERDVLSAAIDRLAPAADPARVTELLRRCVETDGRMRARLQAMRDEVRDHLREMDARRPKLTPYLGATTGRHLDRRY